LNCPDNPWGEGTNITLICIVLKSACSGSKKFKNSAEFQKDAQLQCEVTAAKHSGCLQIPTASEPSSGCFCTENATAFVYKYKFTATNPESRGSWTCKRGCYLNDTIVTSTDLNIVPDLNNCVAKFQGEYLMRVI
jgi:hypothetical protein